MYYIFNKSSKGYSHLKENKPCQDYSASFKDTNRLIITSCDGHGGDMYIRSDRGSEFASSALIHTLSKINSSMLRKNFSTKLEDLIKLSILCDWNQMVEDDVRAHRFSSKEFINVDSKNISKIKENPVIAYGSTLNGALFFKNKVIAVNIGDGEVLGVKKGNIFPIFSNEDEPVGNYTYSLCQEDAYKHLRVKVLDVKDLDGVILCSDGLSSPFQSYQSLNNNFIKPMIYRLLNNHNQIVIEKVVDEIASTKGNGDDVSLSFILKENLKRISYTS